MKIKNVEKREKLIASLKAYRAASRAEDIKMFGEKYWKENVLEIHGSYIRSGVEWEDYYSEEIASGLDNNISMLELAYVLMNDFE